MSQKRKNFINFIDTTLREGQQSPLLFDSRKYRFSMEEKRCIVEGLLKTGIRYFELFSPVVDRTGNRELNFLKEVADRITKDKVWFIAHCRCDEKDIENAVKSGFDGLNLYMSVSKHAQKYSYQKNYRELKKKIVSVMQNCRNKYPGIYLRFSSEDAFRTPIDEIVNIYDEISPFVNTLGIPDTVGIATPEEVARTVGLIKERYPDNYVECHFHNDRGFSLINSVTAIMHGAEFIDSSVWGMGERSGITSMTGLLYNLYITDKVQVEHFDLNLAYPLNIEMGSILDLQVPYTEPVSLTNRTHIAGVHQKAVLKNSCSYEGIDLGKFGVHKNHILLGPLSGWNSIYYYLNEILDFDASRDQAKKIRDLFKAEMFDNLKESTPEITLARIAGQFGLTKRRVPVNEKERRIEKTGGIHEN